MPDHARSQSAPERRLAPGTVVADITVAREIARGATAIVYRGLRHDGTAVALKVGTAAAQSPRTVTRYRNEARLAASMHHPNIVRPIEGGCLEGPEGFEGRMYLVMPLVQGQLLSDVLRECPNGLPELRVRILATQLASALQTMHGAGIVHRDIKPANLIVGENDTLHVIDFGIAYALGRPGISKTNDITLKGVAPGTTRYMSPEQLKHVDVTAAFDIFAFGATVHELLCGLPLDPNSTEEDVTKSRCHPGWKARLLTTASPDLTELVTRCVGGDPLQRPDAEEVSDFFDDDNKTVSLPLRVPPKDEAPPSNPTRLMRRLPVIATGSRPAGEETMVKLVRDKLHMPSVNRVRAELAKVDECIVVPKAQALAAMGLEGDVPRTRSRARSGTVKAAREQDKMATATSADAATGTHEEDRQTKKGRIWLALVIVPLLAAATGGAWAVFNREGTDSAQPRNGGAAPMPNLGSPSEQPRDIGGVGSVTDDTVPDVPPRHDPDGETEPKVELVEPEPSPPREPEVIHSPRKPSAREPKPTKPNPPTAAKAKPGPLTPCAAQRVEARKASKKKDWSAVLASTEDASCWSSKNERAQLRAESFFRKKRYAQCVRAAAGATPPGLKTLRGQCYLAMEHQE